VIDLIGRPYRLGATGNDADAAIDCLHLVFAVHDRLGFWHPPTNPAWYGESKILIGRDILKTWQRIREPVYDGDVLLMAQPRVAFSVFWNHGCLYINQHLQAVAWCPLSMIQSSHCFRSKSA
jgi:hypothetical protein